MFQLDRAAATPLADQIEAHLRVLIDSGRLPRGARLASIRQLAAELAVSPNTVVIAYDRLAAAGFIDARGTLGYYVHELRGDQPEVDAVLEAAEVQDPVWLAQQSNDQRAGLLLASSGALPPAWLEDGVPHAAVQRALARSTAGMASRCPPQGMPELRERIALMLRGQGIPVDAGRVLTTYGGTHAIDLICRAFLRPGDTVIVEDPGYFLMFGRLRQAGLNVVPVARRHDGIDLAQLEAASRAHRPKIAFLQTVLHNPTGWGSTPANLHKVLVLAREHGVLVAEDDVQGHFQTAPATRLAALSGLEGVIYYSSFCKALSPALRLGWIAADPALLRAMLREKITSVLTTPALNELVLLEVLAAGRWRKHLDRLNARLAAARHASLAQLRGAGVAFDHPGACGLFLWGELPAGVDVDDLVAAAGRDRIVLARGAAFSATHGADPHVRFNVAVCQQPEVASWLRANLGAPLVRRSPPGAASAGPEVAFSWRGQEAANGG
jgi:DNA-binding transcriptional MocR family regulator